MPTLKGSRCLGIARFSFFKNVFICVYFDCARSSFAALRHVGLLSSWGARTPHFRSFSSCRAWALACWTLVSAASGFSTWSS